jgi:hypothetical protein
MYFMDSCNSSSQVNLIHPKIYLDPSVSVGVKTNKKE